MNTLLLLLIAYHALGAVVIVLNIGRRREVITPGSAVFSLLIQALVVWAIIAVAR